MTRRAFVLVLLSMGCSTPSHPLPSDIGSQGADASFELVLPDAGPKSAKSAPFVGLYDNAEGLPLLQLIHAARRDIDLEIYDMHHPAVLAALLAAVERGVRVRVVQEPNPVGHACNVFDEGAGAACASERNLRDRVRTSGGAYVPFAKERLCEDPSCFQHGKMMLVDGAFALISTGNFNLSSLCDPAALACSRDYTVITDDDNVISSLARIFEADLAGVAHDALSETMPSLTVGPKGKPALVEFLRAATASIRITLPYLRDPEIQAVLIERASAGIDVFVTVSSFCAFSRPTAAAIARETETFARFDAAGIRVRAFNASQKIQGRPAYLHAKAIVIDGRRAWVGSVNGSQRSTETNREFGLYFDEPTWVSTLDAWLRLDHEDPRTESWSESLRCVKDEPLFAPDAE